MAGSSAASLYREHGTIATNAPLSYPTTISGRPLLAQSGHSVTALDSAAEDETIVAKRWSQGAFVLWQMIDRAQTVPIKPCHRQMSLGATNPSFTKRSFGTAPGAFSASFCMPRASS